MGNQLRERSWHADVVTAQDCQSTRITLCHARSVATGRQGLGFEHPGAQPRRIRELTWGNDVVLAQGCQSAHFKGPHSAALGVSQGHQTGWSGPRKENLQFEPKKGKKTSAHLPQRCGGRPRLTERPHGCSPGPLCPGCAARCHAEQRPVRSPAVRPCQRQQTMFKGLLTRQCGWLSCSRSWSLAGSCKQT